MRRQAPEAALQKAVAAYAWAVLPREVIWSAIPSGGGGKIRGAQLQAMGLRRGLPDLLFMWSVPGSPGVPVIRWIELKSDKGRMSPEQIEFANAAQALGHKHAVCRTVDEVARALKEWGVPSREAGYRGPGTILYHERLKGTLFQTHPSRKP